MILSVLGKLRRLHGVCQANGLRTLNLDEVLVKPGQNAEVGTCCRDACVQKPATPAPVLPLLRLCCRFCCLVGCAFPFFLGWDVY